ncbi:MAG: type II secretion system protein [Burkholderiaceae bacterium]|nr:type II secretion system protein [Burkholderiaceae bacterium]
MMRAPRFQRGFTLIEAIIVISITGVIAAIVSIFIVSPVTGYMTTVRHAQMTDAADASLRRLQREIRLALPNSVRVTDGSSSQNTCASSPCYIEFIPTVSGALYRSPGDGSTQGNFFDTANPNTSIDVMGTSLSGSIPSDWQIVAKASYMVVYNLGPGFAPQDAYQLNNCASVGCNIALITGTSKYTLNLGSFPFVESSPNNRFQVVPSTGPVSYSCPLTGSASGSMYRYAGYGFLATQPTPPASTYQETVISNVTCTVNYSPTTALSRDGILFVTIVVTDAASGDTVQVFREIHVDNAP